ETRFSPSALRCADGREFSRWATAFTPRFDRRESGYQPVRPQSPLTVPNAAEQVRFPTFGSPSGTNCERLPNVVKARGGPGPTAPARSINAPALADHARAPEDRGGTDRGDDEGDDGSRQPDDQSQMVADERAGDADEAARHQVAVLPAELAR